MVYCLPLVKEKLPEYRVVCQRFVDVCTSCMPEYSRRSKVHLLLHVIDDMVQFGPQDCFNTERYSLANDAFVLMKLGTRLLTRW